jgi:hypothetical protein
LQSELIWVCQHGFHGELLRVSVSVEFSDNNTKQ